MATRQTVQLLDDVDGSEATQTVRFGVDGHEYEIDLNDTHAEELRASVDTFIRQARKVGGRRLYGIGGGKATTKRAGNRETGKVGATATKAEETVVKAPAPEFKAPTPTPPKLIQQAGTAWTAKEVRQWAQSRGIPVTDRGRVPGELVERYLAAKRA